jgi:hypothetical protein
LRPTWSISSWTARRRAPASRCTPWISNGSDRIEPTVRRGFSDEYGSWKTIATSRRSRLSSPPRAVVMSWPAKAIEPDVGSSSRAISRAVVLLPQPLSPTSPNVSPGATEKLIPSTACTAATWRLNTIPRVIGKCLTRS